MPSVRGTEVAEVKKASKIYMIGYEDIIGDYHALEFDKPIKVPKNHVVAVYIKRRYRKKS